MDNAILKALIGRQVRVLVTVFNGNGKPGTQCYRGVIDAAEGGLIRFGRCVMGNEPSTIRMDGAVINTQGCTFQLLTPN